ncbi:hypothetical protein [Aureibacter tunicatorum]|uniref:Uncharacterized protein n=1 Tax=Aureibacter tunicatorum TaxID=866807 RepID=A0AAE4BVC1_9BACT|nr:hypothetical protein [Aureibacter tunicatorum]MDR6241930.1 hypothetical protein [Aureibacter tunicatorum]BDD07537.1 hypothetical protein AUTU_50200 [Aureibacter tunicatorum]
MSRRKKIKSKGIEIRNDNNYKHPIFYTCLSWDDYDSIDEYHDDHKDDFKEYNVIYNDDLKEVFAFDAYHLKSVWFYREENEKFGGCINASGEHLSSSFIFDYKESLDLGYGSRALREFLPKNLDFRILSRGFGHDATTLIRIDAQGDYKLYYMFQNGELCPLRVSLKEYYDLFEMTRGMEMWQAFVAETLPENVKRRYNGFFRLMEYLLPEADLSKFSFREEVEQLEDKSKTFAAYGFRRKLYQAFGQEFGEDALELDAQRSFLKMMKIEDQRQDTLPDDILAFYMECGGGFIHYFKDKLKMSVHLYRPYETFTTSLFNAHPENSVIYEDGNALNFLRFQEWENKGGKEALGEYWDYSGDIFTEEAYPEFKKLNVWAYTKEEEAEYPHHYICWGIVDGKSQMYRISLNNKGIPKSDQPEDLGCDLPTLFDWMIDTRAFPDWHKHIGEREFLAKAQEALDIT